MSKTKKKSHQREDRVRKSESDAHKKRRNIKQATREYIFEDDDFLEPPHHENVFETFERLRKSNSQMS